MATVPSMRSLLLVPVVALVVAGCGSGKTAHTTAATSSAPIVSPSSADPASAMRAWWADGGKTSTVNIESDLIAMRKAGIGDLPNLSTACVSLKQDVTGAQALPAPPVSEVADPWGAALGSLASAATECAEGAQPPANMDLLNQAVADIGTGATSMDQAGRAITAFVG